MVSTERGAGGEEAEALPLGHPHPHVPPLPEAGEALGEAFQEFFPVLGLGEGLQGLGEEPVGLGQVLGPAVGPAEAFPHLVRKKGGEEEGGEEEGFMAPWKKRRRLARPRAASPAPSPKTLATRPTATMNQGTAALSRSPASAAPRARAARAT